MVITLLLGMCTAQAQVSLDPPARTVLRIKGLTAETRDAMVADLGRESGVELAYACVPAGILVFQSNGRADQSGALLTMSTVEKRVRPQDITVLPISLLEAEEQCAQARNR